MILNLQDMQDFISEMIGPINALADLASMQSSEEPTHSIFITSLGLQRRRVRVIIGIFPKVVKNIRP
jgi:hypothetical protein